MLPAIVSHTPLWVWALLAYLLYRGWIALGDRAAPLWKVILLPVVMLGLSLQGLLQQFWRHASVLEFAALALLLAAACSWRTTARQVQVQPGSSLLLVRGSWRPLAMTLAIFSLKYAVGVTQALHPAWLRGIAIALALGLLYGMFAGFSLGRVLCIWHLSRQARSRPVQLPV
jgi:uncharacterized membrane protein